MLEEDKGMKKIFLLITVLMLVGCSKKADIVCTEKNDLYTTNVELYFKNGELTNAISISEYKDEDLDFLTILSSSILTPSVVLYIKMY